MIILVYILLICFTVLEGIREAYCDNLLTVDYGKYKHIIYSISRLFVFGIAFIINYKTVFIILMFPFLHDGFYYVTRNVLSKNKPYPKGWFDNGTTAILDKILNKYIRTILFIIGGLLVIIL